MIEKKYTVIYADPPWKYKVWSGGGAADAHYPTMNLEDIKALPVNQTEMPLADAHFSADFRKLRHLIRH